jgi:hypothetical protein
MGLYTVNLRIPWEYEESTEDRAHTIEVYSRVISLPYLGFIVIYWGAFAASRARRKYRARGRGAPRRTTS